MLPCFQYARIQLAVLVGAMTLGTASCALRPELPPTAGNSQLQTAPFISPLSQEQINALKIAPEADDDSDEDQTLADMFLQRSSIGTMTIRGYKLCKFPYNATLTVACGAQACPAGSEMVGWSPEAHPSCNASPSCVDMKALGWNGGHKNNFCRSKGYDGVKPYSGEYRKGGRCFKDNGCG